MAVPALVLHVVGDVITHRRLCCATAIVLRLDPIGGSASGVRDVFVHGFLDGLLAGELRPDPIGPSAVLGGALRGLGLVPSHRGFITEEVAVASAATVMQQVKFVVFFLIFHGVEVCIGGGRHDLGAAFILRGRVTSVYKP